MGACWVRSTVFCALLGHKLIIHCLQSFIMVGEQLHDRLNATTHVRP